MQLEIFTFWPKLYYSTVFRVEIHFWHIIIFPNKNLKSINLPISMPRIFNNYLAGLETRQRGQSVVHKEYLSYCIPIFILNTTRARECNYLLSLTKNTIISETMNSWVCYTPPLSILFNGRVRSQTKTNFAAIKLLETNNCNWEQ